MRVLSFPAADYVDVEKRLAAERSLAAEMFCIESGSRCVDDQLNPVAPPHPAWPSITLPPVTARGLPVTLDYKASAGVIYCLLPDTSKAAVNGLAASLERLLKPLGRDHLRGRASRACVSAIMHSLETPSRRMICIADKSKKKYQSCEFHSTCGFTWTVVSLYSNRPENSFNATGFNSRVAGIVFDFVGACQKSNGRDVFPYSITNFVADWVEPKLILTDSDRILLDYNFSTRSKNHLGILLAPDGEIVLLGWTEPGFQPELPWPLDSSLSKLPLCDWDPDFWFGKELRVFKCFACCVPLSGQCAVVDMEVGNGRYGCLLICPLCWQTSVVPDSCPPDVQVWRVVVPFSQDKTAADAGLYGCATLLRGRWSRGKNFPEHTFLVTLEDGSSVCIYGTRAPFYTPYHPEVIASGASSCHKIELLAEIKV